MRSESNSARWREWDFELCVQHVGGAWEMARLLHSLAVLVAVLWSVEAAREQQSTHTNNWAVLVTVHKTHEYSSRLSCVFNWHFLATGLWVVVWLMSSVWSVQVCASRYWFNYRHVANTLSIYRSVKRLGIPDRCVWITIIAAPLFVNHLV